LMEDKDLPLAQRSAVALGNDDSADFVARESHRRNQEARHAEVLARLDALKKPHWTTTPTFWIVLLGSLAAIAAAWFGWREDTQSTDRAAPGSSATPANLSPTPLPTPEP